MPRITPGSVAQSLTFRLFLLLSFILLPLGAVAVFQTWSLSKEVTTRAETAVMTRTIKAMSPQVNRIERAIGAVEALARVTPDVSADGTCDRDFFKRFLSGNDRYSFAGRIDLDFKARCSAFDVTPDVSDNEIVVEAFASEMPFFYATERGQASGESVLVFGHPVFVDGKLDHYAALSVNSSRAAPTLEAEAFADAVALATFNRTGRVITYTDREDVEGAENELPRRPELDRLTVSEPTVFAGDALNGEPRIFAVVPLLDGLIFAIASYPEDVLAAEGAAGVLPAWLLPFVMWLATLTVVYVAISRLVVTPVKNLARRMRRFAQNRAMPTELPQGDLPRELREMNETFFAMANSILQDEAELEDALREKSILVREIHHRVKNNLQLIASIMNMQIRKSRASETSEVVRRLQERVLGLATVHRQMYESTNLTSVDIGPLLEEILRQILRQAGDRPPKITTDIDSVELIPDQAVPLSLLAAEAAMNAIRYVGHDGRDAGWIEVLFVVDEDRTSHLTIANSVTSDPDELAEIKGGTSGLGTQLIQAFAAQLGGTVEVDESEGRYCISVTFSPTSARNHDDAAQVIERVRGTAA